MINGTKKKLSLKGLNHSEYAQMPFSALAFCMNTNNYRRQADSVDSARGFSVSGI